MPYLIILKKAARFEIVIGGALWVDSFSFSQKQVTFFLKMKVRHPLMVLRIEA